jgi:rod shape determining protein RodA
MKNQSITNHIDWITVGLFITLVILGWLNIYSSSLSAVTGESSIFDLSQFYGKQLLYIGLTFPLILVILFVEGKFYEKYSSIIYTISVLSIAGLYLFGKSVKGQVNWYSFGSFGIQPSEFAKAATALALSKYLSDVQVNLKLVKDQIVALAIVFFPMLLIAGHDPGLSLIHI